MKIWKSVVGKLWITILLLVSFVLFILTILLLEFFESYHVTQIDQELRTTANKIARIVEEHPNDNMGIEMAFEIVDKPTQVIIAYNKKDIFYSTHSNNSKIIPEKIITDPLLSKVFDGKSVESKEIEPPNEKSRNRYDNTLVVGVPLHTKGQTGAIYIYQSLGVLKGTTHETTKIILLCAGIAIILTTFFAFFLSTRIAAPLRRMRQAAFEVAKGKFDTKVPILTHDEIGELATAFNQMGRQLKSNMNALKQEKEQLTSILSSMADGVLTFDRDGTILITNPPAERFLQQWNYGPNQDFKLPAPEEILALLQKVIETEMEQTGELKIQGHSYVVIVSPLYNQKDVRGAVAVLRDMTEERRLDKLRDDFIANVSHELRTPIAMLQGYSEAIIDDIAATDEEKKEFAKIIYDETLRIGRLVNELLDLARMEAGHITLLKEETEIRPFVERVTNKFQGLAREKNVSLSFEMKSDVLTTIELDPDRIEQVLTNLIDNAIRHSFEKGIVKVSVDSNAHGVTIDVRDNGTGIPEEDLPFVFERFYKADKARTRGKSGTGLGLAIAKNIVDAHNGKISVRSKIGQGTTFSFFIPTSKPKPAEN